jgi:hypothetical protein
MEVKKKWHEILEDKFLALMTKYDMPEDISHEIHNFVLEIARDQYKSGNRSGIAWLRKQMSLSVAQPVAA